MAKMVMDPDHPDYFDDAIDDDVDRCVHGVPFDEVCEDCEDEDDQDGFEDDDGDED